MSMVRMRSNRVQPVACRAAVAVVLGEQLADQIMHETGIAELPELLPAGPRDLQALSRELQPFVTFYRVLLERTDRDVALSVTRRAIIDSGLVSHAAEQAPESEIEAHTTAPEPLVLTSPPPAGFQAEPGALAEGFALAMQFFSCEGQLVAYTPEFVRFQITGCNWCQAMEQAAAPELIPFFCETDERFMDKHPTHMLVRPEAIGIGDQCCDFQFVPRTTNRGAV